MEKYNKRVPGRISGVLLILLGGLGMAYKILLVWMDILLMQEFQNEELPELARTQMVFTAKDVCLAILCLILLIWGVRKIVRVVRFYRFKKFIGDREIVALEELAEKFHTSKTKIRSELEMMIQHNYLLQGHVNQEFPCLITTDQKYKEYLQVLETLEQEKKEWEERGACTELSFQDSGVCGSHFCEKRRKGSISGRSAQAGVRREKADFRM